MEITTGSLMRLLKRLPLEDSETKLRFLNLAVFRNSLMIIKNENMINLYFIIRMYAIRRNMITNNYDKTMLIIMPVVL